MNYNQHSPTIIAAIITGQRKSRYLPTHILLTGSDCGLPKLSMVMLEQIRTLDRARLQQYIGRVGTEEMRQVDRALEISIGITVQRRKASRVIHKKERIFSYDED